MNLIWCKKRPQKPRFIAIEVCLKCKKMKRCKEYYDYLKEHITEEGNEERFREVCPVKRRRNRTRSGYKIQQSIRVRSLINDTPEEVGEVSQVVLPSSKKRGRPPNKDKNIGGGTNTKGGGKLSEKGRKVLPTISTTGGEKDTFISLQRNARATKGIERSKRDKELCLWAR